MKIIVGLGNPGHRYRNTRHNAGFRALDRVAERLGVSFDREKHRALLAEARFENERALLVKPLTFMNNSGIAVAQVARNTLLEDADLLVVVDDVNLPLGRLRFRAKGSAGGHNGLKSIIEHLATQAFPRLRLGVGRDTAVPGLVDHVLGSFRPDEQQEVDAMLERSVDAVLRFAVAGIGVAMNEYNGGVKDEADEDGA